MNLIINININILKGVVFASFRVLFGKVHKLYAGIIFFLLATSVEQLCEWLRNNNFYYFVYHVVP